MENTKMILVNILADNLIYLHDFEVVDKKTVKTISSLLLLFINYNIKTEIKEFDEFSIYKKKVLYSILIDGIASIYVDNEYLEYSDIGTKYKQKIIQELLSFFKYLTKFSKEKVFMIYTREVLKNVDYDSAEFNMDYKTCKINVNITKQSNNIAIGVDDGGAGDQGIMFGYACVETENLMPYAINTAHKLAQKLTQVRKNGEIPYLRSDGKVQVTVGYINDFPFRIDTILISTQHNENISIEELENDIIEKVIKTTIDDDMIDCQTKFLINPTS